MVLATFKSLVNHFISEILFFIGGSNKIISKNLEMMYILHSLPTYILELVYLCGDLALKEKLGDLELLLWYLKRLKVIDSRDYVYVFLSLILLHFDIIIDYKPVNIVKATFEHVMR